MRNDLERYKHRAKDVKLGKDVSYKVSRFACDDETGSSCHWIGQKTERDGHG